MPSQQPKTAARTAEQSTGQTGGMDGSVDIDLQQEFAERGAGIPNLGKQSIKEAYREDLHGSEPVPVSAPDELLPQPGSTVWFRLLKGPVIGSLLILTFSALMLLFTNNVFQFVQTIQSGPEPLRWVGYSIIAVLLLLISWSILRLALWYLWRPANPRLKKADIHNARHRPFVQQQTKRKLVEGKALLEQILADYPMQDHKLKRLLLASGCGEEATRRLEREIRELTADREMGTAAWLSQCNDRVLKLIDECARKRVKDYSLRVGMKTAVMPSGVVDLLIVVANSLLMLKDLCSLYNVRTSPWGTCSIAFHLFTNAFVATRLEGQISDYAPETFFGDGDPFTDPTALNAATDTIAGSIGTAFSAVTLGVGKRVAEGTANAILVGRLGEVCIRYLRPIA